MSKILLATNNKEIDDAIGGDNAVYFREAVYEAVIRTGAGTVVLSAFLPGQVGLADVIYMLRRKDVRVIFLAGSMNIDDPLFSKLLQYGVYDIIFNPVHADRVMDVLRNPMNFTQAASVLALPGDSAQIATPAPIVMPTQSAPVTQGEQLVATVPPALPEKVRRTNGAVGTIVAIWSPAATGKTFSAINLSFAAALTRKTALVDYTGAAHTWLNLPKGERGLYTGEPRKQTQDANGAGPDVYTFDPTYAQSGEPSPELLNELRRSYNLIIVDGALPPTAETLIVVADHDIHHLRLIQRALPSIIADGHQNTLLIINNAARLPYPVKYKDELGRDPVAVIPYCPGAVSAILCGEPQIWSDPLLKKTFERIAAACATGKASIISLKRGAAS